MKRPKGFVHEGKRMKWSDIRFEPHQVVTGGVQAVVRFPNGEWCSIIGCPWNDNTENWGGLYGNGETSFEIMSSSTENRTHGTKGWLSKEQVMNHLRYLRNKIRSLPISDDLTNRIVTSMKTVWDCCGHDFIQLTEEYEGRSYCTFEEVSECVVDANRMEGFGGDKGATDVFYSLGYSALEKQEKTRILRLAFPEKHFGL